MSNNIFFWPPQWKSQVCWVSKKYLFFQKGWIYTEKKNRERMRIVVGKAAKVLGKERFISKKKKYKGGERSLDAFLKLR